MPKLEAFISGAWRTPARGEVLIGGAWRRITRGESYRGGGWVGIASFIPPLSLSVLPPYVQGIVNPAKPQQRTVVTDYAYATPVGGFAPYSYAWSATPAAATNPSTASTAFFASLSPEQQINGIATVTCTDSQGNTAVGQCEYYLYNQTNQ
jgi:hypothetical protein